MYQGESVEGFPHFSTPLPIFCVYPATELKAAGEHCRLKSPSGRLKDFLMESDKNLSWPNICWQRATSQTDKKHHEEAVRHCSRYAFIPQSACRGSNIITGIWGRERAGRWADGADMEKGHCDRRECSRPPRWRSDSSLIFQLCHSFPAERACRSMCVSVRTRQRQEKWRRGGGAKKQKNYWENNAVCVSDSNLLWTLESTWVPSDRPR